MSKGDGKEKIDSERGRVFKIESHSSACWRVGKENERGGNRRIELARKTSKRCKEKKI